jgi:hypothetical protein
MNKSRKLLKFAASLVVISGWQFTANASFLDNDFWCRTYGCAVVHDGQNFDIYDNFIFATNTCCVANGSQMISFSTNFGEFNLTNSLNKHIGPNSTQSMFIGITQDGNTVSQSLIDDGDGYLDAGDSFGGVFSMGSLTDIMLDGPGKAYSHSFFITSRNTKFSLRALASIANSSNDFTNTISLSDIRIDAARTRRGNDDGFNFGRRASSARVTVVNSVNDLGDLQAIPTKMFEFDRFNGIRRRNGDLNEQTIRLDFLYTMPDYDMSMGIGSLNIDMVFDLYKEP